MKVLSGTDRRDDFPLAPLGEGLLSGWLATPGSRLPAAPRLVWSGHGARATVITSLLAEDGANPLTLSLDWPSQDLCHDGRPVARTDGVALPLQGESLGVVVLNQLVANGREPQLEEACRLIRPGGRLFILGQNRMGLCHLLRRKPPNIPGIRPLAVRSRLEALNMEVMVMHGGGILGQARPGRVHEGMTRVLLPFAEILLIVARPLDPRIYTPVSARKLRAVGAPSAVAGQ